MIKVLHKSFFLLLGWLFVVIAIIGIILPLLPTVPFLILSAYFFARSSPKCHRMLLNNRWVGAELARWEKSKTVSRKTKQRASLLILATFSISISVLHARPELQVLLVTLASILLFFIWRLNLE